jgi:hypothetical protein
MPRQAEPARFPAVLLAVSLLLAAGAFWHFSRQGSPAPFGVPVPQPKQKFVTQGVGFEDTDVLAGRFAPPYLEFLAPQPDGTIPLRYPYRSDRGDFSVEHPMGAELTMASPDEFADSGLDALAELKYNQPLKQIRYIFPVRKPGEKLSEVAARMRYDLGQGGGHVVAGSSTPLELPTFRFERVEYTVSPKEVAARSKQGDPLPTGLGGADEYHVRFLGPLGPRVLIAEFITTPELIDRARPQIDKIMHSFRPGWQLRTVFMKEFPDYGKAAAKPSAKPGQAAVPPAKPEPAPSEP